MIILCLSHLIEGLSPHSFSKIYQDQNIIRRTFSTQIEGHAEIDGTIDYLIKYQIFNFNLSFKKNQNDTIQLIIDFPSTQASQSGNTFFSKKKNILFWFPNEFKQIMLEKDGRVRSISERKLTIQKENSHFSINLLQCFGDVIDISFAIFTKESKCFLRQIEGMSEVEKLNVTRGAWFYYSNVSDFWKYLVNGKFYNKRREFPFESQLMSYVLYFYLTYLQNQTSKELYAYLRDYVAYLTLLSLPEGRCWRHGIWFEEDIHFVHWIAGVNLFLSYYEISGQKVFLEEGQKILDTCISFSNTCEGDTRWFLHDSFEMPVKHGVTYYRGTIISEAFQKSEQNTLAVNSHIWTLLALHRFYKISLDEKYNKAYRQGLTLLCHVLQENPATYLYSISYRIRDVLLKVLVSKEKIRFPSLIRLYDQFLRSLLLPKLKGKYPRIVMPNGFIERDLTFSFLNEFYHLLNLEQLLMLYRLEPCDWLKKIITRSVDYSIKSKMVIYFARTSELALTFLGVLLQYGTNINSEYLKYFEEYALFFHQKGWTFPVKIIATPLIADVHSTMKTSNPHVLSFIGDTEGGILGIILNISPKEQVFRLEWGDCNNYSLEDWKGNRFSASDSVCINGFSGYKVVLEK